MKKLFCLYGVLSFMLFFVLTASSQDRTSDFNENNSLRAVHDFECYQNSLFSQIPIEYDIAVFCDVRYTYTKVADDYSASSAFKTMRFWGVYDVRPTETFLIEFYDGIPGEPGTTIVNSLNVTTHPVPTPFLRYDSVIHQIDVVFDERINQLNGWVSISRTSTPRNDDFGWIGYRSGVGNRMSYYFATGNWSQHTSDQFFCLGGSGSIPLSNWALGIGIFLILAATLFRVRRYF